MPATVELREEGRVAYQVFSEPWTLQDLENVTNETEKYFDQSERQVHMVINTEKLKTAPPGIVRYRNAAPMTHPNAGFMAIVASSMLVRRMSEVIFRVANFKRAKFFDTEEEAWQHVRDLIAAEGAKQESA